MLLAVLELINPGSQAIYGCQADALPDSCQLGEHAVTAPRACPPRRPARLARPARPATLALFSFGIPSAHTTCRSSCCRSPAPPRWCLCAARRRAASRPPRLAGVGGGREGGGVSSVFFRTAPGMARSNYWVPMKRSQRTGAARATYDKNGATSAAGGPGAYQANCLISVWF